MSDYSSSNKDNIRIVVVDSSRIGSQLLAAALKRDHFETLYASASSEEALKVIAENEADVALISATLEAQASRGFEVADQIRRSNSRIRIILLLETSDPASVVKAFRAGADGVFGRDKALDLLSKCVTRVHQGQVWASTDELRHLIEALIAPPRLRLVNANGAELLAPREQEVVHWVSEGLTNREIADRMGLSENTIKNYVFRIFDKLGISKRIELLLYAESQFSHTNLSECDPATVFSNDATLFRWCREAAERFTLNQYLLAEMYREGKGVAASKETALTWFIIANQLSRYVAEQSRNAIEELRRQMPTTEIAEAQRRAADWLFEHHKATFRRTEANEAIHTAQ